MRDSLRPTSLKLFALLAALLATIPTHAQDWAKSRLEASPRHHEYATLHHGDRSLQAFVVYPEVKNKATVVILIHEIFGLSNWAKEMADELAAQGYIVVAPDLLSGAGPNNGGSDAFPDQDSTVKAVSGLNPDQVLADLDAATAYAKSLPAANGKVATVGFCWGGGKSFAFAAHSRDLAAAIVFYGTPPPDVSAVSAPVYGFYAGNDARVDATIPATIEAMKAANKKYQPVTYDGAGHGFMRAGEDPTAKPDAPTTEPNKKAREQAFASLNTILKQLSAKPTRLPARAAAHRAHPRQRQAAKPDPNCHDRPTMSEAM